MAHFQLQPPHLPVTYACSWLIFASVWYLTFYAHGDFDPVNIANGSFVPCATGIIDFTSCFLFSVETQHTIGYGGRFVVPPRPMKRREGGRSYGVI